MNKTKTDLSLPKKLCRGKRIAAEYHEPEIEPYRNNPLLECLPLSLSKSDLLAALVQSPAYSDAEQKESNEKRLLLMDASLEGFFQPLLRHVRLEQSVSRMIRSGYIGRNPLALDFYMEQRQKEKR